MLPVENGTELFLETVIKIDKTFLHPFDWIHKDIALRDSGEKPSLSLQNSKTLQ